MSYSSAILKDSSFPFIFVIFNFFHQCLVVFCVGLSPPWLNLFLGILFFLVYL